MLPEAAEATTTTSLSGPAAATLGVLGTQRWRRREGGLTANGLLAPSVLPQPRVIVGSAVTKAADPRGAVAALRHATEELFPS